MKDVSKKRNLVFLENAVRDLPQTYIFWKDTQSVYLGCNNSYANLIGLKSAADIVGKTDLDLGFQADGDTAELFRKGDQETMKGKFIVNQEEWLSLPNGKKVLVLVNKGPIYDENNKPLGVLGIATDITEKKRIEEALQEAEYKLDGMTLVSASLAHELRTPLAALSFGLETVRQPLLNLVESYKLTVKSGLSVPKVSQPLLESVENQLNNMQLVTDSASKMIDILLKNVKPINLQAGINEVFSASDCVQQALDQYPFQPSDRKLVVFEARNDFLIKGNLEYLMYALFNLLKNALFYVKKAGKGDIQIWLVRGSKQNKLYFKDTGAGIPIDILPHIFNRFFTRTHHGAGIGLAFCKMAMSSFKGDIVCESEVGQYTQFLLAFPKIENERE